MDVALVQLEVDLPQLKAPRGADGILRLEESAANHFPFLMERSVYHLMQEFPCLAVEPAPVVIVYLLQSAVP